MVEQIVVSTSIYVMHIFMSLVINGIRDTCLKEVPNQFPRKPNHKEQNGSLSITVSMLE